MSPEARNGVIPVAILRYPTNTPRILWIMLLEQFDWEWTRAWSELICYSSLITSIYNISPWLWHLLISLPQHVSATESLSPTVDVIPTLAQCWVNVRDVDPALSQRWDKSLAGWIEYFEREARTPLLIGDLGRIVISRQITVFDDTLTVKVDGRVRLTTGCDCTRT